MMFSKKWIYLPILVLSLTAVTHNAELALDIAALSKHNSTWDKAMAIGFAIGIELSLWGMLLHKWKRTVKTYTVILFIYNIIFFAWSGGIQALSTLEPVYAYLYIVVTVLYSLSLSGGIWILTEIIIADHEKNVQSESPKQYVSNDYLRTDQRTVENTPKVFSSDTAERSLHDVKETVKQLVAEELKHTAVTFSKQLETIIKEHLQSLPENRENTSKIVTTIAPDKASSPLQGPHTESLQQASPIAPPIAPELLQNATVDLPEDRTEQTLQTSAPIARGSVTKETIIGTTNELPTSNEANIPATQENQKEALLNAKNEFLPTMALGEKEPVKKLVNEYNDSNVADEVENAIEEDTTSEASALTERKTAINKKRSLSTSKLKLDKKTCRNCSKSFKTANPKKSYCSNACRAAYSRANQVDLQVEAA